MSWSISTSGKPAEVAAALKQYGQSLTGESKAEYDDVLPHLLGLVEENFREEHTGQPEPDLIVEAHGSGVSVNGEPLSRECAVTITRSNRTAG